jgi:hypothetical protein
MHLGACVFTATRDGEAVPEPSTLDAVMELLDSKRGVAIRAVADTHQANLAAD